MSEPVHHRMTRNELFIAAEVALLRSLVKRGVVGLSRYYNIHNAVRHAFRAGYAAGELWLMENLPQIEPGLATTRESRAYTAALGYLGRVDQEMLGSVDLTHWREGFEARIGDYCQQRFDDEVFFLPEPREIPGAD